MNKGCASLKQTPITPSMWCDGLLPAAGLAAFVTLAVGAVQALPFGRAMLLVRVDGEDSATAALLGAARADAAFVNAPAPGLAIVYGDASRVRRVFGIAIRWNGTAPCSPPS